MLTLTRPQYAYIVPVLGWYVWVKTPLQVPARKTRAVTRAGIFLVSAALPVLLWMSYNFRACGVFTISTLTGGSLANHMISVVHKAPPQFEPMRSILIEHREKMKAQHGGVGINAVWSASPELSAQFDWSWPRAERKLRGLVYWLIREYPSVYWGNVFTAWWKSWWQPYLYWSLDRADKPWCIAAVRKVGSAQLFVVRFVNAAFWLAFLRVFCRTATEWIGRKSTDADCPCDVDLLLVCLIAAANTLLPFLVEGGDEYYRFFMPVQGLVYCAAFTLERLIPRKESQS